MYTKFTIHIQLTWIKQFNKNRFNLQSIGWKTFEKLTHPVLFVGLADDTRSNATIGRAGYFHAFTETYKGTRNGRFHFRKPHCNDKNNILVCHQYELF